MAKNQRDQGYRAFRILQWAFIIAPIIAGLDKFFNVLTSWSMYLSSFVMQIINYHDREFMMIAGVIEIIAGIGVALKPKIFSYIVFLWLLFIIINLLIKGMYFDIALRDFGLLLGALALGKLSQKYA